MPRIAYVNGRYLPLDRAGVSIQDRGLQFADSVYEVIALRAGHPLDLDGHLARLKRSLDAIAITDTMKPASLYHVVRETIRRSRLADGLVYVQITRGSAPRNHVFPVPAIPATTIVIVRPHNWSAAEARSARGIAVVTEPDPRWKRCDIKATGLLPAVLAKQRAKARGAEEIWFVDDQGFITEGASSNAWIVTAEDKVVTRPLDHAILAGITRDRFLRLLNEAGLPVELRPFDRRDALAAKEAFITSAGNIATSVLTIDGQIVGDGKAGPVSHALRASYWRCSN